MGDHRAEIHITARMHGVKKKLDLDWINYCDMDGSGMDHRVADFFETWHSEAMAVYQKDVDAYFEKRRENDEKKEYERLKGKFG